MTKLSRWSGLLLTSTLLLAACSSGEGTAGGAPAPGASPGGTITIGMLPPRAIAPWLVSAYDPSGSLVASAMCDPIIQLDAESGEMTPGVADRWRLESSTAFLFEQRDGLTFSDGRKVTSRDVTTSLSRPARSEFASPVASLLDPVLGSAALRGLAQEQTDPKGRERLLGVEAPTGQAVIVKTTTPNVDYFRVLGHTMTAVVPEADVEADGDRAERRPVCVGPYRLEDEWRPGAAGIRLVRSATYHRGNGGYTFGGRGYADILDFRIFPDATALMGAYERGEVDVAYVPPELVEQARAKHGSDLSVIQTPTMQYVGLPTRRTPYESADLRLALSLAVDRTSLAEGAGKGIRTPATRFLPPSLGAIYEGKDARTSCERTAPDRADPEAAKKAGGGALPGDEVPLYFSAEFDNAAVAEAVAQDWRKNLGLKVKPSPMSGPEFIAQGEGRDGFQGPFLMSWTSQYPDPTWYLQKLFAASEIGRNNFAQHAAPRLDRLMEREAPKKLDEDERVQEWVTAEQMVCAGMPMIPITRGGQAVLVRAAKVRSAVPVRGHRTSGQLLVRELFRVGP